MSHTLEEQLDAILNVREQRRWQHELEQAKTQDAMRNARAEHEHRQARFCSMVAPLVQQAMQQANRHLAGRSEKCQFCEVSGHFTGPLHAGGSACNPIAYQLRVAGQEVGETLLIELTYDGMVQAFMVGGHPSVCEAYTTRMDTGWQPIPLYMFNASTASEIVARYLAATTTRWPLGGSAVAG
jgi:hypothetical protein